ncbi:MAG: hypothetical protein U0271_48255 [Polyangiaceae bacterium]
MRVDPARVRTWLGRVALGCLALPILGLAAVDWMPRSSQPALVAGLLWTLLASPVLAIVSGALGLFARSSRGSLGVVDRELVVRTGSRERRYPLEALEWGSVSPLSNEVEIAVRGSDRIHAKVSSVEAGQALLQATGLDEQHRTLRVQLGETTFITLMAWLLGPTTAWPAIIVLGRALHWPSLLSAWSLVAILLALPPLARRLLGPATLTIGSDGLLVQRALTSQFVPFADLQRVTPAAQEVTLHVSGGRRLRLHARHLTQKSSEQLMRRIDLAHTAWSSGGGEEAALASLERGGRSLAEWRDAMRDAIRGGGYRDTSLQRDEVVGVLESHGASDARRLGAALALVATGDDTDRVRVAKTAEACANPRLRVAFDRIAAKSTTDAELEAALAELEATSEERAEADS